MIRDEDGLLTGYVYIDVGSEEHYQQRIAAFLASNIKMPQGYAIGWSARHARRRGTVQQSGAEGERE